MMLPEETRIEPSLLGQPGFFDDLIDTPGQVFTAGWVGDGTVDTEFHGTTSLFTWV
jgi:hypothetical protein